MMHAMPEFAPTAFRWATAMFKQFPTMSTLAVVMVTVGIGILIYIGMHITTGIPVAISRVQMHHFLNYVGFPVDKREWDSQSICYGDVTITNISATEKVALNFVLHITGPGGVNLKSMADLIGPFGMILGKDDTGARKSANQPFGEALKYFRNPVELEHGQIEKKRLEFLFDFGSELRDKFAMMMMHDQDYKFDLEISDLISGRTIVMHLPEEYRSDQ